MGRGNSLCKSTEASDTLSELCVPQCNSVAGIKGLHEGPAGTQGEEVTRDQIKRALYVYQVLFWNASL